MNKGEEKIVFQGEMIEIVQERVVFENGREKLYEHARRAPGIRLIIHTPDGKFLISKEERKGIGTDYRLQGGKLFDSLDEYNSFLAKDNNTERIIEKARDTAIKEGMEEVGVKPLEIELFLKSRCGGSLEWDLYYFVVKKYEEVPQDPEDGERIEPVKFSEEELKELALSGKMQEDRSVAVLLKYLHSINK